MNNVVFDLGRVLIDFEPRQYLQRKFPSRDPIDDYLSIVFSGPEWLMLDRGVVTQEQVVKTLSVRYPEHALAIREIFSDWFSMLVPINEMVAVLRELDNRGYPLYALSNFHRQAFHYLEQQYDWFLLFAGKVISYECHYLKPEPEIYHILMSRYGLIPEETLFIDDTEANVVAAKELGFQGIHFSGLGTLRRELDALLLG